MEGKIRSGPGFYSEIGKKARGFSSLFQFIFCMSSLSFSFSCTNRNFWNNFFASEFACLLFFYWKKRLPFGGISSLQCSLKNTENWIDFGYYCNRIDIVFTISHPGL